MGTKIDQEAVRNISPGAPCCERCHQLLDPATAIWLDLNCLTLRYSDEAWPEEESQGCFAFGPDCARAVLAAGGECVEIRDKFFCGARIQRRPRKAG